MDGLDSLSKVLASVSSPCDLVCFGVSSVSRLMHLRAGVPRGVLSEEPVSGEQASVVFPFWLSVLDRTARVFAKEFAKRLIHTHWYLGGVALRSVCYLE